MLGAVLTNAFKDDVRLNLHSFAAPNIQSGSFFYDIVMDQKNWQPSEIEKRTLSAAMVKLAAKELKFERLEVNHDVALEMFKDNPFKREQLPSISRHGMNGYIDICISIQTVIVCFLCFVYFYLLV